MESVDEKTKKGGHGKKFIPVREMQENEMTGKQKAG